MVRTFLAIDLPNEVKDHLLTLQNSLKQAKADVRWVKKDLMHLTMRFLGEVAPDMLPMIGEAASIATNGLETFELKTSNLGVFPNLRRPRVIWVGLAGKINLLNLLKEKLDNNLLQIGFPKEDRPFSPHLTLGRIKSGKNISKLSQMIIEQDKLSINQKIISFKVKELLVYKSVLSPSGPSYTILSRHSLR